MEVLVALLHIDGGALQLLLRCALVVVHGGADLVHQVLALLLNGCLLLLSPNRATHLPVDSVVLLLHLISVPGQLHHLLLPQLQLGLRLGPVSCEPRFH